VVEASMSDIIVIFVFLFILGVVDKGVTKFPGRSRKRGGGGSGWGNMA